MNDTKAIILAAGEGKRLNNLTKGIPKCMVTIGRKRIIDYQLDALIDNGIKDAVIVVGYLKERLISYLTNSNYNNLVNFEFVDNDIYKDTNSCYSLWTARQFMTDGYIHLNSDLIFHPDLLRKLLQEKSSGIIVDNLRHHEDDMVRGRITKSRLSEINKKIHVESPDCIIVGPAYFSGSDVGHFVKALEDEINSVELKNACYLLFDEVLDKINMLPVFSHGLFWKEVDTLEDIRYIERTYEIFFKSYNESHT